MKLDSGGLRSELILHRLDVRRQSKEVEDELLWEITLISDKEHALLVGRLLRRADRCVAQAVGSMFLYAASDQAAMPHPGALAEWAKGSSRESLYDLCRRSLVAQAAWFDADLGLPLFSPDVDVRIAEPSDP